MLVTWKQREEHGRVFGAREWAAHFGSVPGAPALPPGIEKIWQGGCPVYPGKKVSETHMFVYIPATVNGQPLTLRNFGILAKQYFPETADGYRYISDSIVKQLVDRSSGHACWVLMTDEGIPGSEGKVFIKQRNIVTALLKTALPAYEVPRALDATVCILARFVSSKMRLFSDSYTRCQEDVNGDKVIVGGLVPAGFLIGTRYAEGEIMVAGLRKFF